MTTSFSNLFRQYEINKIEIPIIQRDYAQGRPDGVVPRIRSAFLDVLHRALTCGENVSLDFVYGEVNGGTMTPLDGQQRLTTLFLLHWYIAARVGVDSGNSEFLRGFTYETRFSSRDFCSRLVEQRPLFPIEKLSDWICDQNWFFSAWRHDPTIQSMLVVLDDIHARFKDSDCNIAWQRLTDTANPAIVFHILPIKNMGLTDDLYIKMNSRGKPLTRFEHFKANFEKTVRDVSNEHYKELIDKIDNAWADLLWPLRGDDDIIDDEFMRLFRFITDILIYLTHLYIPKGIMEKDIDLGSQLVYGKDNPNAKANQRYLFDALDCWVNIDVNALFKNAFTEQGYRQGAVAIFDSVDIFSACCKDYGIMEGRNRRFSLQRMLLLFAVLEHQMCNAENFTQRIRNVRNLIFGSENEIRLENFPRLLEDTREVMRSGDLRKVEAYNKKQIDEELSKAAFLSSHPELQEVLYGLEDHTLTRGCISVFEFDSQTFSRRAALFHKVFPEARKVPFPEVSAAFLACGDYSQKRRWDRFQFGSRKSSSNVWRQLLTNTGSDEFKATKSVLMQMLDALNSSVNLSIQESLQDIVNRYLASQEEAQQFDWRYYLVKYDEMRDGQSGLYVSSKGVMAFDLCMLDKVQLNSYYRDPYLFAVFKRSGAVKGQDVEDPWHYGYESHGRWMTLIKSGVRLTCRKEGFLLSEPSRDADRAIFTQITTQHHIGANLILRIPQVEIGGVLYDTQDRVQAGAKLVQDLIKGFALSDMGSSNPGASIEDDS